MQEYISDKQFREISKQIHFELEANKRNDQKINELKQKLVVLKHLRAKSMLLEKEEKTQKGLL